MASDLDDGISPHICKIGEDPSKIFDESNLTIDEIEDLQKVANTVSMCVDTVIFSFKL